MQQNSISKSVSVANEDALIDRNSVLLTKVWFVPWPFRFALFSIILCLGWVKISL